MGSAWGLSDAGKEAGGFPREYGAYGRQRMKDWLTRGDQQYSQGTAANDWFRDYNQARVNDGLGPISTMRDFGKQILPGIDDYVANKSGRIQDTIRDYASRVPQAAQTMGKVNQYIDESGDLIRQNRDYALTDIGDTFHRGVDWENEANRGMLGAYDSSLTELEKLKPGSQFQQAEVARSFAPANATLAGRLRRGGMDMTSPQAIAFQQRGDLAQGRAMDERAAEGTEKYISAKRGLTLDRGGEGLRHAGALTNLDLGRSGRALGVQDTATQRGLDWEKARGDAALLDRSLNQQDWLTNKNLSGELSDAEKEAIGMRGEEFNAGRGYQTDDLAYRDKHAASVGDYGTRSMDYGFRGDQAANEWGNTGMNAYNTTYAREAPKAGWATKAIAGAAGAGLDLIAPGAGTIVRNTVGGTLPGYGGYGGGGYGSGGGYGFGGYTPNGYDPSGGWGPLANKVREWATPRSSVDYGYYDPNKTRTNPDGSITVGR